MQTWDIQGMDERIRKMRILAEELKQIGRGIPSVEKNVDRILASITVLELNISEVKPPV
ncbi:MAG: hypothetical protein AB1512_04720 [Thermodesulfobacteriota bacterium]